MMNKQKILLIEDSPLVQMVYKVFLQGLGFVVDIAENGKKAINMFKNDYHIILLDIGLPDISGFEVAKYIRESESIESSNTSIIIVLSGDEKHIYNYREAGCDAFHVKPIDIEILGKIINEWLTPKRN